jgi:hypothetical protein
MQNHALWLISHSENALHLSIENLEIAMFLAGVFFFLEFGCFIWTGVADRCVKARETLSCAVNGRRIMELDVLAKDAPDYCTWKYDAIFNKYFRLYVVGLLMAD